MPSNISFTTCGSTPVGNARNNHRQLCGARSKLRLAVGHSRLSMMSPKLEVILSPAEFASLQQRDLSQAVCVVFDVLRATTSMITALANGAEAIIPVAEIA